ncbi:SgcJ/EcaC family oxidoreductase [Nonomuraea sp. K274]|uniref:SgcJ/EcaC family oxidoreductase n=1 Tax=Nonomuraea cypriaca TaxID=1187855 RepID=A0A931ABF0_9ACTN|nr:nuclear transport factor 2 family protein [Nonomuraea cypriaca]MBF8189867.1 SgcJ/EcaC family oxidoreductase [Nonomuraea cypriaca]
MSTNEQRIRTLIERWAEAVHRGDLDAVVAHHAEDIVMYDVPPPHEGVRGLDAYRKTWPPFFAWQALGAVFEIESLDVTAGDDVAFAHALLRCGTPEELTADPGNRLRLTLGLRQEHGRWVVSHEHHSFPIADRTVDSIEDRARAEQEVRRLHERWFEATAAKDLDAMMSVIAADVDSYEHDTPLRHQGVAAVREICARGLDVDSAVTWDVPNLRIMVRDDLAVAWGLNRVRDEVSESWSRGTRVFERRNGDWVMIHQHLSYPYDPDTGAARTDLHP